MLSSLRHRMSQGKLPFEVRMIGLALLAVNIPSAIVGLMFCWIILPIPGLILYGFVIAIALGKLSENTASMTAILSIIYHGLLLILLFGAGASFTSHDISDLYLLMIPLSSIAFGLLMLNAINEPQISTHEKA
ncbi:MAG: hypothetical protein AAF927_34065 [Bacteroidota bacterium]